MPHNSRTGTFQECDLMSEWQGHGVRFRSWYSCSESLKMRRVSCSLERSLPSSPRCSRPQTSPSSGVRGSVKAAPLLLGTSPCPDLVAILAFICCEESSSSCQVQAHGFTVSMRIISLDNTVLGTLVGVCRREESVANMSTGLRIGRDRRVIQASASAVRSLLIR